MIKKGFILKADILNLAHRFRSILPPKVSFWLVIKMAPEKVISQKSYRILFSLQFIPNLNVSICDYYLVNLV